MFGADKYRWIKHPGYNGGGSSGGGTSTTTPEIPEELKPLAKLYVQQAEGIAQTPFQEYDGQRYAGLNDTQNQGIQMAIDRAQGGSATFDNAENSLNQFIAGGANPYLDQMFNQGAEQVRNNVNSNFSQAGRYGSGAHTDVLTDSLGDMATQMYGGAYENDQARRMQAMGMAPQFANQAYQDAGQMMNVGGIQQQDAQNPLDFAYDQFSQQQDYPFRQLQATGGVISGNMGSSTVSNQDSGGK